MTCTPTKSPDRLGRHAAPVVRRDGLRHGRRIGRPATGRSGTLVGNPAIGLSMYTGPDDGGGEMGVTMPTAHCVSTVAGIILTVDQGFLDLVGMSEEEVVGASYRDITHPDDLGRSATMLASLVDRAPPFRLQKRYIRPDGTIVVANLYVTRFSEPDRLVSTVFWNDHGRALPPARLWEMALRIRRLHAVRKVALGADLATDPVWSMLNCIYLAEAEGRVIDLADITTETGMAAGIVARWIQVLEVRGLIELGALAKRNVQLTHLGMAKMEAILSAPFELPISP